MASLKNTLSKSIETIRNYSFWVWLLVILNITFIVIATSMVRAGVPWVIEHREHFLKELPNLPYLKPIIGPLSPYLSLKILYTFSFNLIFGAFISTTITGIIFFFPILISMYRAWFVGVVFYGFATSPVAAVVFLLTLFLEFGGYILSSVAGINIGLSIIFPGRYGKSRLTALTQAIKEAGYIYIIVAIFLLLGAIWEMTSIHFLFVPGETPLLQQNLLDE